MYDTDLHIGIRSHTNYIKRYALLGLLPAMSHFASNTAYGQEDVDNDDMIAHIRSVNGHQHHLQLVVDGVVSQAGRCSTECEWGSICNTRLNHITISEKNSIFGLFEGNMKDIYCATWGWDRLEKVVNSFTHLVTHRQ